MPAKKCKCRNLVIRELDCLIVAPKADSDETAIRDYIVCNYAEIFEGPDFEMSRLGDLCLRKCLPHN